MKVSLSEVMKKAWSVYRARRAGMADWQIARRPDIYSFSAALQMAWAEVKKEIAKRATLEALSDSDKSKLARLIKAREDLDYLPSHMNYSRAKYEIDEDIRRMVGFLV